MKHPNAATALVAGGGGGQALVEILDRFGVDLSAGAALWLAAALAGAALFVGRRGLKGIGRLIWRGDPSL